MDMFEQDEIVIYHHPIEEQSTNQTYGDVVKDFIMDEKQNLRDLQVQRISWTVMNLLAQIFPILFSDPSLIYICSNVYL